MKILAAQELACEIMGTVDMRGSGLSFYGPVVCISGTIGFGELSGMCIPSNSVANISL